VSEVNDSLWGKREKKRGYPLLTNFKRFKNRHSQKVWGQFIEGSLYRRARRKNGTVSGGGEIHGWEKHTAPETTVGKKKKKIAVSTGREGENSSK